MKKVTLIIIAIFTLSHVKAQLAERLTFATSIGAGIAISTPSCTPFTWQISGHYNFNQRFSAGIGAGLSIYEKALIPIFANAQLNILSYKKVTPYVDCSMGYGVAPGKDASGGLYLNPSAGLQYSLGGSKKIFFAVGYELQKLAQLKKYENQYLKAAFEEHLSHGSILLKVGYMF